MKTWSSKNEKGVDIKIASTWKLASCSVVSLVVKLSTTTALLSSCNLLTEATALFLPTSFSENTKLLDKSHNSTSPSSCKVTDFTPARMRFFAAGSKLYLVTEKTRLTLLKSIWQNIKSIKVPIWFKLHYVCMYILF